jgi:uridine monophosphate synthetase
MTQPFFKRLEQRIKSVNSLLCIGLDPHPELLSVNSASGAKAFCLEIIEDTAEYVCAYKPNSAFFEAFGGAGLDVLKEVIDSVPDEIPVILDAKRGDIASTANAYQRAAFQVLGADAMTLSPYLGWDSIEPMLVDPHSGAFLLCKTSNPGAQDFQARDLETGEPLYLAVARSVDEKELTGSVGLVVGATDTEALAMVRSIAPEIWILAPGVGPQGGDLNATLRAGLRHDGMGLVLPVSRSIAQSADRRATAEMMRDRINQIRSELVHREINTKPAQSEYLADYLLQVGCVKFGEFTLKSGIQSPIYIDLRLLASYPKLLSITATAYRSLIADLEFDRLAAIPYAALPIGTAISIQSGVPMIYPRKEVKGYGTQAAIEGQYEAGTRVLVIDDLVSSGESKFEAINQLVSSGLVVEDISVLIDREGGAGERLAQAGYRLHSVFTLSKLIKMWEGSGRITGEQAAQVKDFIRSQD